MKLKNMKTFEEHSSELNISDVSHSFYGEIKIGDTIEWSGEYFSGYDKQRGFKNDKKLQGINKVRKIFKEGMLVWMELDNGKQFIIKNLRNPDEIVDGSWKKL
jgi:hypothetical protein